ncbi:MAG: IclR family transcriptional regulator [Acidimicrobiales bacterium]
MDTSLSGVGVIDKAAAIISALEDRPASLGDLVVATGLSRATAHRLAAALVVHGLVRRLDDGRFALGLRCIGLGHRVVERFPLVELAPTILTELRDRTGESTQLYVRDGSERVCVAAIESTYGLRTMVSVGARLTMEQGSAGRVLRGECAPEGFVESRGEREPGVGSVSAPVIDRSGTVQAAISISGPIERLGAASPGEHGSQTVLAARQLESALGWR